MVKKMKQKGCAKLCCEEPDRKRGLKMTFEMPSGIQAALPAKVSLRFELGRENEAFSCAAVLRCSCRV